MAVKTPPKYLVALAAEHRLQMLNVADILDLKRRNHPQLLTCYREKSEEYFIGLADGVTRMFETMLHKAKYYQGFSHVYFVNGEMHLCTAADVENDTGNYQSWCRNYHGF